MLDELELGAQFLQRMILYPKGWSIEDKGEAVRPMARRNTTRPLPDR